MEDDGAPSPDAMKLHHGEQIFYQRMLGVTRLQAEVRMLESGADDAKSALTRLEVDAESENDLEAGLSSAFKHHFQGKLSEFEKKRDEAALPLSVGVTESDSA